MINVDLLDDIVRDNIETLCRHFFPDGKKVGHEWRIGNTSGEPGRRGSLRIELRGDKAGLWRDEATGQGGSFAGLVQENRGVAFPEAARVIGQCLSIDLEVPGTNGEKPRRNRDRGTRPPDIKPLLEPFKQWPTFVAALTPDRIKQLHAWRGLSHEFIARLAAGQQIGWDNGNWVFPVTVDGAVVAVHRRVPPKADGEKADWFYDPKGIGVRPFVLGDLAVAGIVHASESPWDMLTLADLLAADQPDGVAMVATRGAGNAKLLACIPIAVKEVYLWPQNDQAGEKWLADAITSLPTRNIRVVRTPEPHKDLNEWTQSGAAAGDLSTTIAEAELFAGPLAGNGRAPTAENDATPTLRRPGVESNGQQPPGPPTITEVVKTLDILYDSNRTSFWVKNDRGAWMLVNSNDVRRRLKEKGYTTKPGPNEEISQVDRLLTAIQHSNDVDYADSLAGYETGIYLIKGKRILVRDSPMLLEPSKGDCPLLVGIFDRMLGQTQQTYFFGWLKIAVEALYTFRSRVGQALVLAGPADCGKSLTQYLITLLLGGRLAMPHRYMAGLTPFNSELLGSEHLVIEDEEASTDIRARRKFGASIKLICANQDQSAHAKYRNAITLTPFWRLSISVNDEPENLMILPPIDKSLEDKFIILKAEKHSMPMETVTDRDRQAFIDTLRAELPHFLQFLFDFKIPAELTSDRYGITHFHHPEILEAISAMAPETRLLEMIDARLFDSAAPGAWQGSANKLERELTSEASCVRRPAERLLTFHLACGTFLGRLQKRYPERFASEHTNKGNVWTISPP